MKVHVASYQAVSILRGGPNTQIRNTMKHMAGHGVDVTLFNPWSPFTAHDCDLFHLFAANIGTYHLAREIRALGVPFVVSPIIFSNHSPAFLKKSLALNGIMKKVSGGLWSDYGMTAEICSWSKKVLPNTQDEADLLHSGLGVLRSNIKVIPNGVDERFANGDPSLFKKKYGLEGFILNVGHIGHERKNVLKLIQALATINHPAVIIGRIIKGKYGDACVQEAAKHKHILLIDGLENDSDMLASAYAACDVFVLPSMFETPGIAALEAGLAGAKIIITAYGGTREYFGDMATYVEPGSVDSIRSAVIKVLDEKKTAGLSQHIIKEYLWQRVAEKTAAVYREVSGRS